MSAAWAARRLAAARLYLCTDARQRQGDLEQFLDAALRGGVDIVQLRQKGLPAQRELEYARLFAAAAARHGALWSVNDRADIAVAAAAPALHLGQDDLPVAAARAITPAGTLLGRSTHDRDQVSAAAVADGVNYFSVGPCWATPTKPGRPATGVELLRHAAAVAPPERGGARPWFAIGGIDAARLEAVLAAGARRIVVVRAITEAEDPEVAARALRSQVVAAGAVAGVAEPAPERHGCAT